MKISDKIRQLKSLDIDRALDDSLKENEKEIVALAQSQMYDKGIMNVQNPSVKEKYAPGTIAQKKKKARYPKTDFITLRWMGDFYESMKLIIFKEVFVIGATDLKWVNYLEPNPRFENALGLTEDSIKKVRDFVLPGILKRIKL